MKVENEILTDLLLIYEKRNNNNSNFNKKIKINLNDKEYFKYFQNRDEYDEAIKNLLEKDLIKCKYLKNEKIIEYIYLNTNKIDEIYILLNRTNEIDLKRNLLISELAKYDDDLIKIIEKEVLNKIENNKSIKKYCNENFINSIKAIHFLENLEEPVYIRNLSNKIFNDSKKLEELKGTIISIYQNNNIFEEKGVLYTTPFILLKGDIDLYLNNYLLKLNLINMPIQIPIENIDSIEFKNVTKVTTVENLTTFYNYTDSGLILYLGGFPTKSQIEVIKKIKKETSNFYHFGDIDYGGFKILDYLIEKLETNVLTVNMDVFTLEKYRLYQAKITDNNYIEKLKTLLLNKRLEPHYDVINYMIGNKVKLEQESIYNNIKNIEK